MASPDCFRHICYERELPAEVLRSLESIYQSPFCVAEYFKIFRNVCSFNAMVITCGECTPRHVVAYVISGREITVLNELVGIEKDYIEYFAAAIYDRYPLITTVNFNFLKIKIDNFNYPWRHWKTSHDIAITLPLTFGDYHARLGPQTKKHIKYYINKLQRDYSDFSFQVATPHEIDPSTIGKIVQMNRLRMKDKNIRPGYDHLFENRISEFCRHYGLVSTVSVRGQIVAGAICYEVGRQVYLEAIAHDPDFNKYNAGQVCLYLTVRHMIESGKQCFHMLWGENEYKYRFLGVKEELHFISIYRSYLSKLKSTPRLAQHACSYIFRQLDYLTKKYIINRCIHK